jgi:A/G-specific adenine glycosylase
MLTGVRAEVGPVVRSFTYGVTKHRVRLDAHAAHGLTAATSPGPGVRGVAWELPENLNNYPFSSAGRRLIGCVVRQGPGGEAGG